MNHRTRIWIPEASNLILDRGPCPRTTIEVEMETPKMMFEGWFDVKLIDARTKRVKRHLRFKNLITNAGLDFIAANSVVSCLGFMGVGTGGTAPTNIDTTLQTAIGTRVAMGAYTGGPAAGPANAYWWLQQQAVFLEPNANGNLTEVGLFSASAGGSMWTRQLFKDGTGTPTVITKTASDQLQITYELRLYSPTADVASNVTFSAQLYNYTTRASNIGDAVTWGRSGSTGPLSFANFGGSPGATAYETDVLGTTSGFPAGTGNQISSGTVAAYAAGSFFIDHTYIWEPGNGNFPTGIGSMIWGRPGSACGHPFQISWAPKIAKTATKRLTLVGRLNWGRYP